VLVSVDSLSLFCHLDIDFPSVICEAERQGTLSAGDEDEYSGDEDEKENFAADFAQFERDLMGEAEGQGTLSAGDEDE
jgi:hypothetical protein